MSDSQPETKQSRVKHGKTETAIYKSWTAMKSLINKTMLAIEAITKGEEQ